MNKLEREEFKFTVKRYGMDERYLRLLYTIDEKDALIADVLALLESGWSHVNWMIKTRLEYDEKLAALKARAEK